MKTVLKTKMIILILSMILTVPLALSCGIGSSDFGADYDTAGGSQAVTGDDTVMDTTDTSEEGGPRELVILTDQKNNRLAVYDLANEELDGNIIWQYSPSNPACTSISGVKYRTCDLFGDVVITCASGGYAAIISYPEGRELWSVASGGNNPHSVELLPNGNLAVASSTGNSIRLYTSSQPDDAGKYYVSATLEDAHGVLWDPEYEVLWALGGQELCAYKIGGTDERPTLAKAEGMGGTLPSKGGHDLAAVYGDDDLLWITTGSAVVRFKKSENKFLPSFDGALRINVKSVKGIGTIPETGTVVRITPNGTYKSWNSNEFKFFTFTPDGNGQYRVSEHTRKSETGAFYKIRVFCRDYN